MEQVYIHFLWKPAYHNWQLTLKFHIIKFVYLIEISALNIVLFKGQGQESLVGHAKKFGYHPNVTESN